MQLFFFFVPANIMKRQSKIIESENAAEGELRHKKQKLEAQTQAEAEAEAEAHEAKKRLKKRAVATNEVELSNVPTTLKAKSLKKKVKKEL